MNDETKIDRCIFLTMPHQRIPHWYPQFAHSLKQKDIQLIPIVPSQLKEVFQSFSKAHIMVMETDFTQRRWLRKRFFRVLYQLVKNNKATLYHLSSFDSLDFSGKYIFEKKYFFEKVPQDFESLTENINKFFSHQENTQEKWPGGRSPTLSRDIGKA